MGLRFNQANGAALSCPLTFGRKRQRTAAFPRPVGWRRLLRCGGVFAFGNYV